MAENANKPQQMPGNFRVDGCEKKKVDWMGVLLMRESATLHYRFKEGCDIQGSVTPKILQSFPLNLDLRNIKSYNRIETSNTITADLQKFPILNLEMREGTLSGKETKVKFEADYKVQISVTGGKTVQKNLGGEIRISEINGKKANIKEKILIK